MNNPCVHIKIVFFLLEFTVLLTTIICRGEKKIKILHKVCEKAIVHDLSSKNIRASYTKKKEAFNSHRKKRVHISCSNSSRGNHGGRAGAKEGRHAYFRISLFSMSNVSTKPPAADVGNRRPRITRADTDDAHTCECSAGEHAQRARVQRTAAGRIDRLGQSKAPRAAAAAAATAHQHSAAGKTASASGKAVVQSPAQARRPCVCQPPSPSPPRTQSSLFQVHRLRRGRYGTTCYGVTSPPSPVQSRSELSGFQRPSRDEPADADSRRGCWASSGRASSPKVIYLPPRCV